MSDPALHTALLNVGTPNNAFDIAYHMSWPSSTDPFYLANTGDNDTRRYYYGVNSTPTMKCDGLAADAFNIQPSIQSRMSVASPLWMDLTTSVSGSNLNLTCNAVANVTISGNYAIHLALLDRYSYLSSSPNGQPNHYHAMRDLAPTASGQAFSATVNDTVHYYATFPLSPSWDLTNLDVACFVQNNTTKEVLQSHCEQVPVNIPGLYYLSYTLQDNGNNDGRAEPGETASVFVTLGNLVPYQPATNVVGTLSTTDPTLTITTPAVNFPNIPNGGTGTNASPFLFQVSTTAAPHTATLHLVVVADPLQTSMSVDIPIFIGWPDVLLVDDDGTAIFETYYIPILEELGATYEHWVIATQGIPPATNISSYDMMVWLTGFSEGLSTAKQDLITAYLNGGGKLFITGQNIAQGLNTSSPTFLHNVLHANFNTANTTIKILNGVAGNPVGDGLVVNCNPGGTGSGSCTSPDGISVLAPASEAFVFNASAHRGGLTYTGTNNEKLVFFSFPYEAVSGQSSSNTRTEVMQAVLDFFGFSVVPPALVVTLDPVSPPIIIPPTGGSFSYNVTVTNNDVVPITFDGWNMVQLPTGTMYGPVLGPVTLTLPAGASITRLRSQSIPGSAPSGAYSYISNVGDYPATIISSDNFPFTKSAAGNGSWVSEWNNWGEELGSNLALSESPQEHALQARPNPFNPSTIISFNLQEASLVDLTIYDVSGREVITLMSGLQTAGMHEVTFEATGLPSGVYLYRLHAGNSTAQGKMVLLK